MKIDIEKLKEKPRNFPNFFQGYLEYTKHLESPTEFHVWTAISMVAGALRGKCFLDMGYFRWKPNCFIIFVAPPGVVAKSTTSGVGTDLLRSVPNVNFGPNTCTWQALLGAFEEVTETFEINGKKEQQSCLTLEASELGTFLDFNDNRMIDVMVDIWDGKDKPLERRTIGGGVQKVESPWVNLIACTTPSWISQSMPRYAIGGGFTSRCIFVYADKKEKFVPYPEEFLPAGLGLLKNKLVEDLTRISLIEGTFTLSKEAKDFGRKWYVEFNENKPAHLKDEQLAGYAARKQTHLHKVAMCLSAARSSSKVIEMEDMSMAMSLLGVSEQNMIKVFENISDDKDASTLTVLRNKIIHYRDGIERADLFLELSTRMSYDSFDRALNAGVAAGLWDNVLKAKGNLIRPTKLAFNSSKLKVSKEDTERVQQLRK